MTVILSYIWLLADIELIKYIWALTDTEVFRGRKAITIGQQAISRVKMCLAKSYTEAQI